ncbi:hypothetical protein DENSPDRAFT_833485 [Dentipellis sp. KUC8613]|nr:hypothetical protein DENSPDRAFT_833485 [Dentipellis sp. KUC8613]
MNSNFAVSFAPYAPPPDEPTQAPNVPSAPSSSRFVRPWFSSQSSATATTSYQSGGIPTWNTSASGGIGSTDEAEEQSNQWETRFGWRVDMLSAFAYILGPISAFAVLILETHNDYVRFHAYQSALLTTPLVLFRLLASLAHFPSVLRTFITMIMIVLNLFMAFQAYRDASRNGLARFHLPTIGPLAEQWLQEE